MNNFLLFLVLFAATAEAGAQGLDPDEVKRLEIKASNGDLVSLFALATNDMAQIHQPLLQRRVWPLMWKSAQGGYGPALEKIGDFCWFGQYGKTNARDEALQWYAKSADKNDARAMIKAALLLRIPGGGGQESRDLTAYRYLLRAEKLEEPEAADHLLLYYIGRTSLPRDEAKLIKTLESSSDFVSIGRYYQFVCKPPDMGKALMWYRVDDLAFTGNINKLGPTDAEVRRATQSLSNPDSMKADNDARLFVSRKFPEKSDLPAQRPDHFIKVSLHGSGEVDYSLGRRTAIYHDMGIKVR